MIEAVFSRENGWIPGVVNEDGELRIRLGAGADALHDPRTFDFPIEERHLEVIREDLTRHLLLWSAILPLCQAAGIRGPLDEGAAVALLDPILLGTPVEVDAYFRSIPWDKRRLIAQHADLRLLERGEVVAAMRWATVTSDWELVKKYDANRSRARRGVRLKPLDEALLKYTGRYLHGGKRPSREPKAVPARLLPEVMRVIATAEQACAGMSLSPSWGEGEYSQEKKAEWQRIEQEVDRAVRRAHPELAADAVRTVSFLMCSEAADRARES
ncbi:DUF6357 family protein [Phytomonospora sp. NPDC050363]|uniref:DUF6357 family protein n=1 Tax=Phytomonospora sp. NPDC050363 TaxID=3155642 RepID=UPI00340C4FA6